METVCVKVVFVGRKWSIFLPHNPQKLDPKISPHGIHTVYDSVCGAGNGQFSFPTKTQPQDITPWCTHCFPNMREKGFFNTELVKMINIEKHCILPLKPPKKEGEGYPPTPLPHLKFSDALRNLLSQKHCNFGSPRRVRSGIF